MELLIIILVVVVVPAPGAIARPDSAL